LLFFVWSVFEMFTWLSKSILIMNFVPVFYVLILHLRPSMKSILKIGLPFFFIFIFLYPVISTMRGLERNKSLTSMVINAINIADEEDTHTSENATLLDPLNRTFITGELFMKDVNYINTSKLFDFSLMHVLLSMKGAADFQTHVIDGISYEVAHSSGTSGIMDPLLHGGQGLIYVMIILLLCYARLFDKHLFKRQHSIDIQLFLILWTFCAFKNISAFYDGVGLVTLFAQITIIYIASKVNYKEV